jgi:replication factor C subunit 2/4
LETGNLPHLLFYGPPGTGKTSSILAMAMELYGRRKYKDRVTELNASDERGINVVRNKIVTFAKTSIGTKDPRYPCPPYKIIILDEADAMTTEAQSALRKTMEDNSHITRFCFICNYINQIIEPIKSRCVKIRFKPLSDQCMNERLNQIALNEGMTVSGEAISGITKICDGDLRKGIMFLQNLCYVTKIVTLDEVYMIAGYVPDELVNHIRKVCIEDENVDMTILTEAARDFRAAAYPIHNIINQLQQVIVYDNLLSDKQKSIILMHFAKTEKRLIDGSDEYLQLLSLFVCISSVARNSTWLID